MQVSAQGHRRKGPGTGPADELAPNSATPSPAGSRAWSLTCLTTAPPSISPQILDLCQAVAIRAHRSHTFGPASLTCPHRGGPDRS